MSLTRIIRSGVATSVLWFTSHAVTSHSFLSCSTPKYDRTVPSSRPTNKLRGFECSDFSATAYLLDLQICLGLRYVKYIIPQI